MAEMFGTIDQLGAALTFHRERHTVLAGNVANVDTPGYKPIDVIRPNAVGGAEVGMAQTQPGHLASNGGASPFETFIDETTQAGPDGNAVNLERELSKSDANRVRYATSSELVSRKFALLRYAAQDGSQG